MIAPRFLENAGAMRAEYPVLILFAALGMGTGHGHSAWALSMGTQDISKTSQRGRKTALCFLANPAEVDALTFRRVLGEHLDRAELEVAGDLRRQTHARQPRSEPIVDHRV